MATTVFPTINVTEFALVGGGAFAAVMLAFGAWVFHSGRGGRGVTVIEEGPSVPKAQWTMPQLTFLAPAVWSSGRTAAMLALRAYLVVSVALLVVKAVQLGSG
jgi:hypothetical protein